MNPLLHLSALQLAALIREKKVSPIEVVDAHIQRIEQVNPRINAVVWQRFDVARSEAAAAGTAVATKSRNDLPPLWGVPCTIKEAFALTDAPHSSGSIYRRHVTATEDAVAVQRLRAAGAIVLGVTNVPEMGMWMESHNLNYGRTNNPYDVTCTAGGSSGGEAAIIGAGGSPFGLGSDIGGSIRMPAFFCGVAGHKPTGGMVPLQGHCPQTHGKNSYYCAAGPISRRASDLSTLLAILTTGHHAAPITDASTKFFAGRQVWVLEDLGGPVSSPQEPLQSALGSAIQALAAAGASVKTWHSQHLKWGVPMWLARLGEAGGPKFSDIIGKNGGAPNLAMEVIFALMGKPRHTWPALILSLIEPKRRSSTVDKITTKLIDQSNALAAELDHCLRDGSILLMPPHPRTAPKHRIPMLFPFDWLFTGLINIFGLPATVVPTGFDGRGLPVGVQIVANHHQDALSIQTAVFLERHYGGWQPPSAL